MEPTENTNWTTLGTSSASTPPKIVDAQQEKLNKLFIGAIILLVIIMIGQGVYYFYNTQTNKPKNGALASTGKDDPFLLLEEDSDQGPLIVTPTPVARTAEEQNVQKIEVGDIEDFASYYEQLEKEIASL
jgi:hypothetical protein